MTASLSVPGPASSAQPLHISPVTLKTWLRGGAELSLLDVREEGVFARKHLLLAVNAPAWRLEVVIRKLVPRLSTRIVVVDLDESLTTRAAEKLRRIGYTDLHILAGGTLAWEQAGYEVFSGVNLPSKAFGEVIEHELGTPNISVQQLHDHLEKGDNVVVVDGRTPEEFTNFSIPGAHSLPNGELAYRIAELAPDPSTLVVVNCAGRTRSILGAQTLISAGIPNRVVALRDGTMAWLQSGFKLNKGLSSPLPEPSLDTVTNATERAAKVARAAGLKHITVAELAGFQNDADRSLYRLDVRTREEYESGHLPGWRWAAGGQLIQATDQYIGTRRARVVIADWDGVRALSTAAWIAQLGSHDVYLFKPQGNLELETGPETSIVWTATDQVPRISPAQLKRLHDAAPVAIFDVESSLAFAKKHIAGAKFAAPDRLPELLANFDSNTAIVITSADGLLAQHVATQLRHYIDQPVHALAGGNKAWFSLQWPTAEGRADILTGDDDDWYSPYMYETESERLAKMAEYLDWEVNLANQLKRDGDLQIKLVAQPATPSKPAGHAAQEKAVAA